MHKEATPTAEERHAATVLAVDAKAEALTVKHGAKVTPILFYRRNDVDMKADPVIGYLKDPPRLTKFRIIDEGSKRGEMEVANELLQICLLKEESDYRLSSDNQEFDDVILGACIATNQTIIRVAIEQLKKN